MQTTRRRIATMALACVLLLTLSGSYALASGDTKQKHTYKGVISAVEGNQLTLKGDDVQSGQFTLNSKTKIHGKHRQAGSISDLKPGMKAKVRTKETSKGSEKVKKVRVHMPKKATS